MRPPGAPASTSRNQCRLARSTGAASNPSTYRRTSARASACTAPGSASSTATARGASTARPCRRGSAASTASRTGSPGVSCPPRAHHDSPSARITAAPASRSTRQLRLSGPSMNSAPYSTGCGRPSSSADHTRPPTRSRASTTCTSRPTRSSVRAAINPARPAPITMTSVMPQAYPPPPPYQAQPPLKRPSRSGACATAALNIHPAPHTGSATIQATHPCRPARPRRAPLLLPKGNGTTW